MTKAQKTAWFLGLSGLIPFLIPSIGIWFVDRNTAQIFETAQVVYAVLIISFMGGVQWGYAVKQGDIARLYQFIISVIPTLIIFGMLFMTLLLKPHHIALLLIGLLVFQAIVDQKTYIEGWFLKLRWLLTIIASLSLGIVTAHQYYL